MVHPDIILTIDPPFSIALILWALLSSLDQLARGRVAVTNRVSIDG